MFGALLMYFAQLKTFSPSSIFLNTKHGLLLPITAKAGPHTLTVHLISPSWTRAGTKDCDLPGLDISMSGSPRQQTIHLEWSDHIYKALYGIYLS